MNPFTVKQIMDFYHINNVIKKMPKGDRIVSIKITPTPEKINYTIGTRGKKL